MRRRVCIGFLVVLASDAGAGAEERHAPPLRQIRPAATQTVRHGTELTAAHVGPIAGGYIAAPARYAGTEIRDGRAYPFAREIAAGARYDGFDVAGPHLLIEAAHFTGPLDIYARLPIVFRGVSVRLEAASPWAIHTRPGAGGFHFLWSDAGARSTEGAPGDRSRALQRALYLRSDNAVIYRSRLSRTADGIQLHAPGARIVETLIDELTYWVKDHNDGIQMLGRAADAVILRNRIINPNKQTSCLNLIGDRVRVEGNHLSGGGWVIYGGANANGHGGGPARQVVITGNVFGREHFPKGGHFGIVAYWDRDAATGNVWSHNRMHNGAAIEP